MDRLLGRREVLGALGAGAVGTLAGRGLGGAGRAVGGLAELGGRGGAPTSAGLAPLASRATTATGQVQRFLSRPDLQPAAVQLVTALPGQAPGLVLMDSHAGPGQQGPLLLDSSGQVVWFNPLSAGATPALRAFNVSLQQYGGRPVLAWFQGAVVDAHGQGHYVLVDKSYRTVAKVFGANGLQGDLHEFFVTPRGSAIFTCYGTQEADLSHLGGPRHGAYFYGVVQEVDIATGKLLWQWRSDQHVPLPDSYAPLGSHMTVPWDYLHINSVSVDGAGDFLISARNTWCVYKVSRATGAVLWRMGGKRSQFRFGPDAQFAWQHHVVAHAGGLVSIFDNGSGDYVTEPQSRGIVLRVNEKARTADLVLQFTHPGQPVRAGALGSVQLLPDGHVFVGWGAEAAFTEYDSKGRPVLDGRLAGHGIESYRAFRSQWQGSPPDVPAVALRSAGNGTEVAVSWNGATAVDHWVVLGGSSTGSLSALGQAPRRGFETLISVPQRHTYLAVQAVGRDGRLLGRSRAVRA